MKTTPAAKPAPAPAPAFNAETAKPVAPTRHDGTARTFAFVQGEHLFSATEVFVATDGAAAKAALEAAAKAKAEAKPSA